MDSTKTNFAKAAKALESIKGRRVLDTDLCKVIEDADKLRVFALAQSGIWVEFKDSPKGPKGLVEVLDLAMLIVSGRVWVQGAYKAPEDDFVTIQAPGLLDMARNKGGAS